MKLIETQNRNLKFFWINKLEDWIRNYNLFDKVADKKWKEVLWNKLTVEEIDEYGLKIFNQTWGSVYATDVDTALATGGEKNKYLEAKSKDDKERKKLDELEDKRKKLEESVQNYEADIKNIIGSNEITDWNKKVVKADIKDKDITDLQNKVNSLNTEKNNLDQQLKAKQDQILNHKCDTPNNNELNQLKDDLKKANQEKERLQTELNNKKPNTPLPTPQQREEDKKEEQENQNLTAEELKAKLNSKLSEIRELQKQLERAKQSSSQSTQNNKPEAKFLLGMATSFLIVAVIGGMICYQQKKKKKQ